MRCFLGAVASLLVLAMAVIPAFAHFGMIIPSQAMPADETREINATFSFSHPFERVGMNLEMPTRAAVVDQTGTHPLTLEPATVMDHAAFTTRISLERPGAMTVFMEPAPYFEPAEDIFIIHYTKTVIPVWNDDAGWDRPVGLPTEIIPLSRPFALYAGNAFQGQVLIRDTPVPFAEVEVEYFNRYGNRTAPSELMITQTVRADQNGVFTYVAPWAGWWGFAALSEADSTLPREGVEKKVEIGAVLWVEFVAPVVK